jgi:peptide/nickel transport system ATP-binding protein
VKPIITISDLSVCFHGDDYQLTAIDDVHFSVYPGETIAIIGESGSGKSVLGLSILGLLPDNAQVQGTVKFEDKNLIGMNESEMRHFRGRMIAWISQNPKIGFNPSMKMWKQIAEPEVIHTHCSWPDAKKKAVKLLDLFHILPSRYWAEAYPVSYSGGMLQRAMVAMGTCASPKVIIADEPTKGVDCLNKSEIVQMFSRLKEKGITQILITHDLDFAADLADRVMVMYCGQIVENTDNNTFFTSPLHPYSRALIQSLPQRGLCPIPGTAPPMHIIHTGCRFLKRCMESREECHKEVPFILLMNDYVRCMHYDSRNRAG